MTSPPGVLALHSPTVGHTMVRVRSGVEAHVRANGGEVGELLGVDLGERLRLPRLDEVADAVARRVAGVVPAGERGDHHRSPQRGSGEPADVFHHPNKLSLGLHRSRRIGTIAEGRWALTVPGPGAHHDGHEGRVHPYLCRPAAGGVRGDDVGGRHGGEVPGPGPPGGQDRRAHRACRHHLHPFPSGGADSTPRRSPSGSSTRSTWSTNTMSGIRRCRTAVVGGSGRSAPAVYR